MQAWVAFSGGPGVWVKEHAERLQDDSYMYPCMATTSETTSSLVLHICNNAASCFKRTLICVT